MKDKLIFEEKAQIEKSNLHKKYEYLWTQIELKNKILADLEDAVAITKAKINTEFYPIEMQLLKVEYELLNIIDSILDNMNIAQKHEKNIEYYFAKKIEKLMPLLPHLALLENLYLKYTGYKFGEMTQAQKIEISEILKEYFGIDIEPDELTYEKYREIVNDYHQKYTTEKKAKASKKQNKKTQLVNEIEPDAKAIYFGLIKQFHPDTQQDETKMLEYTEITKNITKAYKSKDYLGLLQLQIKHYDKKNFDPKAFSDDILGRYIVSLQKQLGKINENINALKVANTAIIHKFLDDNLKFENQKFQNVLQSINHKLEALNLEISEAQTNPMAYIKTWFKTIKDFE